MGRRQITSLGYYPRHVVRPGIDGTATWLQNLSIVTAPGAPSPDVCVAPESHDPAAQTPCCGLLHTHPRLQLIFHATTVAAVCAPHSCPPLGCKRPPSLHPLLTQSFKICPECKTTGTPPTYTAPPSAQLSRPHTVTVFVHTPTLTLQCVFQRVWPHENHHGSPPSPLAIQRRLGGTITRSSVRLPFHYYLQTTAPDA